jgi:hypothetical protein
MAMASPEEFSRRMGNLATRVARNADRTVRKAALAADQAVVMQTPVDTGRARANWIAALNAPADGPTADEDKGGGRAVQQAAGVVASYDGDRDVAIHITNNLPYIQRLDEGSSYQAPAGFVRLAVRRGIAAVKGARLLDPRS